MHDALVVCVRERIHELGMHVVLIDSQTLLGRRAAGGDTCGEAFSRRALGWRKQKIGEVRLEISQWLHRLSPRWL